MLGDLWWGGRVMFEKVFDDGDYFERFFRGNAARACASRPGRRRSRRHPAVADVLEQLYELPGAGSRPTGCRRSRYCRRVSGSKVVGRIMLEFRLALTSNRIMEIENARFIGHLLFVFGLTACRYRAEPHVLCAAMERTLTRQRPHRRRVPRLVIPS